MLDKYAFSSDEKGGGWGSGDLDEQKACTYIHPDCLITTRDNFRKLTGLYWETNEDPDTGMVSLDYSRSVGTDDSKFSIDTYKNLNNYDTKRMSVLTPYIEYIEFNPYFVSVHNPESVMPNITMPLRLYASELNSKGDNFWNILLNGGDYGLDTYTSIVDSSNVAYYDTCFMLRLPYSTMEILGDDQYIGRPALRGAALDKTIQIKSQYLSYNESVRIYQDYVKELESELLIPSSAIYATIINMPMIYTADSGYTVYEDANEALYAIYGTDLFDYISYPHQQIIEQSLRHKELEGAHFQQDDVYKWLQKDLRPSSTGASSAFHSLVSSTVEADNLETKFGTAEAFDLSSKKKSIYAFAINNFSINYQFEEGAYPSNAQRLLFENYLSSLRDFDRSMPDSIKQKAINKQRNILYVCGDKTHSDFDGGNFFDAMEAAGEGLFPYSNKITIPVSELGSSTEGRGWFRQIIDASHSSAKILETLKDVHNGEFPEISFRAQQFEKFQQTEDEYSTESKIVRELDFVNFLVQAYNNPEGSINPENYSFVGFDVPTFAATMGSSGIYRYADNQNILNTLNNVLKLCRVPLSPYLALVGATPTSADAYVEEMSLVDILQPQIRYSEIIAYRVEKVGGINTGDQTTQDVLQNFWIYNAEDLEDLEKITINDTQVKYGQNYTYNISAYVVVVSRKYSYSDWRLTQQTGLYGLEDQDPDLYCVQFYDPLSNEATEQLFTKIGEFGMFNTVDSYRHLLAEIHSSEFDELEELSMGYTGIDAMSTTAIETAIDLYGTLDVVPSAGDVSWKSIAPLSIRNEFSTDQQGLSRHPQLADLNVNFEPCVKLIEVPIYSKTLKVLDNPPNDIEIEPFQFLDQSRRIGFDSKYQSYEEKRYPSPISVADNNIQNEYLHSTCTAQYDKISKRSLSPPRYLEIYRIETKPTKLSDFSGRRIRVVDLKIEDSFQTCSDVIVAQKIATNKKYYYIMRYLNENRMPGHLSQIIEAELVDDGGYIYSSFNVLSEEHFERDNFVKTSISFKKLLQLQPNLRQLELNTEDVDFSRTASAQLKNVKVGIVDETIWGQTFKLRLTSKKTGKKLDLNVTFKLKEEDRYSNKI